MIWSAWLYSEFQVYPNAMLTRFINLWHFRFIGFVAKISVLNSKLPMDGLFVGKKNEMFSGGGIPFFFFFFGEKKYSIEQSLNL